MFHLKKFDHRSVRCFIDLKKLIIDVLDEESTLGSLRLSFEQKKHPFFFACPPMLTTISTTHGMMD